MTLMGDTGPARVWMDLSRRLGFEMKMRRSYRRQTKGKVERSIECVRNNLWPSLRFTDGADRNRRGIAQSDGVANLRASGTTGQRPADRLEDRAGRAGVIAGAALSDPVSEGGTQGEPRRVREVGRAYYGVL